jgi:hypothetical protein
VNQQRGPIVRSTTVQGSPAYILFGNQYYY